MKLSLIPNKNQSSNKPINHFNTFSKVLKIDAGSKKQQRSKISKTTTLLPEPVQFKYANWHNMNEVQNQNPIFHEIIRKQSIPMLQPQEKVR